MFGWVGHLVLSMLISQRLSSCQPYRHHFGVGNVESNALDIVHVVQNQVPLGRGRYHYSQIGLGLVIQTADCVPVF